MDKTKKFNLKAKPETQHVRHTSNKSTVPVHGHYNVSLNIRGLICLLFCEGRQKSGQRTNLTNRMDKIHKRIINVLILDLRYDTQFIQPPGSYVCGTDNRFLSNRSSNMEWPRRITSWSGKTRWTHMTGWIDFSNIWHWYISRAGACLQLD